MKLKSPWIRTITYYALINQLWGPDSNIFGLQLWRWDPTNRMVNDALKVLTARVAVSCMHNQLVQDNKWWFGMMTAALWARHGYFHDSKNFTAHYKMSMFNDQYKWKKKIRNYSLTQGWINDMHDVARWKIPNFHFVCSSLSSFGPWAML